MEVITSPSPPPPPRDADRTVENNSLQADLSPLSHPSKEHSPSESPPTATGPRTTQPTTPLSQTNGQGIGRSDLAQRLQVPPEVIASDPERAAKIAAQADANQPQTPAAVDNGIGILQHHQSQFYAGVAAGAGEIAKGAAQIPAGIAAQAQDLDLATLSYMDEVLKHKDDPEWKPTAIAKELTHDSVNATRIRPIVEYWELLKSGDYAGAQEIRSKYEHYFNERMINNDLDPRSYSFWKAGQSWQDMRNDPNSYFYGNPIYQDSWSSDLVYGAGYLTTGVAGTVAAGMVGGPAAAMTMGASVGAAMGSSSEFDKAIASGVPLDKAREAAKWGAFVGVVTSLPMGSPTGGQLLRYLGAKATPAIRGMVYNLVKDLPEAVAAAAISSLAENLIARGIYDPEKGFIDGTGNQVKDDSLLSMVYASLRISINGITKRYGHTQIHSADAPRTQINNGDATNPGAGATEATPNPTPTQHEAMLQELDSNSRHQTKDGVPTNSGHSTQEKDTPQASAELEGLAASRKQALHDELGAATTALDNPILDRVDKVEAINALPDDLPDLAVPVSAIDRLEAAEALTAGEAAALRDLAVDGVVAMPQKTMLTALVSMKDATERSAILSTIDHQPGNDLTGTPGTGRNQSLTSTLEAEAEKALDLRLQRDRPALASLTKADRDYYLNLEVISHGPQRHDGEVTRQMLIARIIDGEDPMTGTTTDAVTGETHQRPNTAGRFKTPQDYVTASRAIFSSPKYPARLQRAVNRGEEFFRLSVKLEDVFGPNYLKLIEGVSLKVRGDHRQGYKDTDYTGGSVFAFFVRETDGTYRLETIYPEPGMSQYTK